MKSSLVDIRALAERFEELAREVAEAWEASAQVVGGIDPEQLRQAMRDLEDVLITAGDRTDSQALADKEIRALGKRGTSLCVTLARQANLLGLDRTEIELRGLPWSFAVWVSRHDGEIDDLEPLQEALTAQIEQMRKPDQQLQLFAEIDEVLDAVCPAVEEQIEAGNPPQAWRYLLINRALVATRSHKPELMCEAFDSILENIPEDAPRFFEETMRDMKLMDYPRHVRTVISTYFQKFGKRLTLH